jgi:uncharacterized membrane protein YedE/YeeE
MRTLLALAAGALFGLGLIVSDMVNPARVLGFLDVAGAWDPTLAFVMAGAMIPMFLAWRLRAARVAPLYGGAFPAKPPARIDGKLLGGAALFGAGWGLVGFCPGPALVAIGTGNIWALYFATAMVIGMAAYGLVNPTPRMTEMNA